MDEQEEAAKLLAFRDKMMENASQCVLKRMEIENRLRKQADDRKEYAKNHRNGRLDLVPKEYIKQMTMDYTTLRRAMHSMRQQKPEDDETIVRVKQNTDIVMETIGQEKDKKVVGESSSFESGEKSTLVEEQIAPIEKEETLVEGQITALEKDTSVKKDVAATICPESEEDLQLEVIKPKEDTPEPKPVRESSPITPRMRSKSNHLKEAVSEITSGTSAFAYKMYKPHLNKVTKPPPKALKKMGKLKDKYGL